MGAQLHLIHPLGFFMDDTRLRRAGLDYHDYATVVEHLDFGSYLNTARPLRLYALSGRAQKWYTEAAFQPGDGFLFGPESVGLGEEILTHAAVNETLRIPMLADRRSLNLANSVAITLYEAWRQNGFPQGT